jgi:coenzyme F420-reducing hydrogenase beta subunit
MRVREGVAREIARGWKRVIYENEKGERGLEMGVVANGIRGKEKKNGESSHGQGEREREKKRKKRRKRKKRKGERNKFDFEAGQIFRDRIYVTISASNLFSLLIV